MDRRSQRRRYHPDTGIRILRLFAVTLMFGLISACSTQQNHSTAQHQAIDLAPNALPKYGVAFVSPSTVTGREEDKQALAFIVAQVLLKERPDIRQVSLPQTLGAINNAGLASDYKQMVIDYQTTGIFSRNTLVNIGDAVNARYLIQVNLASFNQGSRGRFSLLGYRLFQTKLADIRMFIQIWDTSTGMIAWEGVEELILAEETHSEKVINFTTVVEESARNLIALLPESSESTDQLSQNTPAQ